MRNILVVSDQAIRVKRWIWLSILLTLCVGCGRSYKPPWPADLDLQAYRSEQHISLDLRDKTRVRIAGARLARRGIYVDLYCCSSMDQEHATLYWGGIGRSLSLMDDPSVFIEMQDPGGNRVQLQPMREPDPPGLFAETYWKRPPTYVLSAEPKWTCVVQVCIWRTKEQLEPGYYTFRLRSWPFDELVPEIDHQEYKFYVNWVH